MQVTALTAARAVHYIALMELFGGFVFLLAVARPVFDAVGLPAAQRARWHRRMLQVASWSLFATIVSGAAWLAVQASIVSGQPLAEAMSGKILGAVWFDTQLGRVWQVRLALGVLLAIVLWVARRRHASRDWLWLGIAGAALSGLLVAAVAFVGHAVSTATGGERVLHLASDAIHLLAAAAWLGALLPLYPVLRSVSPEVPGSLLAAQRATARFSILGITCVSALIITGLVNSWFLVGNVPGLVGTAYGRLLLVKLALFAAMLSFAAVNRTRLTPHLLAATEEPVEDGSTGRTLWRLGRNALVETGLGVLLLIVVAQLGLSIPAEHAEPVWPFPFAFDWEIARDSPPIEMAIAAAALIAALGAAAAVIGARRRRYPVLIAGFLVTIVALAGAATLVSEPAVPTRYAHLPVRYDTVSIARGEPVFQHNCAVCHGQYGYGDGPEAASLPIKPANLTGVHLLHHGEGTLFWWVSHGIAGTPMPAFADVLSERQRWDVLNFLRAQADAEAANIMTTDVEASRPAVAPDFGFQVDDSQPETLKEQRGRYYVLLVLVGGANSRERLRQLEHAHAELEHAGIRVVVAATDPAAASFLSEDDDPQSSKIARAGPDVAATYGLFRREASPTGVPAVPRHLEFLIDRQGYLRFRWNPDHGPGWAKLAALLQRVDILNREPPRPPAPEGHVH